MINLLPPETKESFAYARRNTKLLHWIFGIGCSIVGIVLVVFGGLLYMNRSIASYNQQIVVSQQQLKTVKLDETQKQVEDITSSLRLVVQVLSKEVLFSKLLQKIGAAMPPGTVLTALSINKLQGGIDLQAQASDYTAATRIQLNLSDKNNSIFDKADINSIQCADPNGSSTTNTKYPCNVSIRAQFGSNSQFYIINGTTASEAKP